MRLLAAFELVLMLLLGTGQLNPAGAQPAACADFDAWEWAQAVFESDPTRYDTLGPDTDGEACPDLPRGGFAPAFWTDDIPDDVEAARMLRVLDGDTFEVELGGVLPLGSSPSC